MAKHHGASARRRPSQRSLLFVALMATVGLGYLALSPEAQSQISSRIKSVPDFTAPAQHDADSVTPKSPVQAEMPAPPPTRYVPGMEEALIATGPVSDQESKDLDAALAAFHDAPAKVGQGGDYDDYAKPLLSYIEAHPQSNWNAALYTNIGLGYYHAGYYSRTFTYLDKAWQLGRNATSPQAHMMVDRAVGELAKMHARVGHDKELEALFADIGKRPIGGPATELIQGAHEGHWAFKHNPGFAYLCGPNALKNVLVSLKAGPKQIKVAMDARSGPHGFSLPELAKLADKAKLKYTLIHREAGQPIPVPSIINWNIHHYAAIIGMQDGAYIVQDPTFANGGGAILTAKAIDAEGSGYFLVPQSVMASTPKNGWRIVNVHSPEAKAVYGMGSVVACTPGCTRCDNQNLDTQNQGKPPMTTANAHTMVVSLNLSDTPVGYRTQKGATPALTSLTYNQRESEQPAGFGFSNVSSKWSYSWMASVKEDPIHPGSPVQRVAAGGGGVDYPVGYSNGGDHGFYTPEAPDNSVLWRYPLSTTMPTTKYVRNMPDGGQEVYSLSDGATTYPRNFFLTQIIDPQGNTTTLNYDGTFRLTSVTDPMTRSTTFTYGITGHSLLISKITDAFGRFCQLTYDPTSLQLATITDPIGITSSFTYSATETTFVTQLTTPYGTSKFTDTFNPTDPAESNQRALVMTDPLGYSDYLYFYQSVAVVPDTDPPATVPTGMSTGNSLLEYRNVFYWDKHAFTGNVTLDGSGNPIAQDFTKARLTHWLHEINFSTAYDTPESTRNPLEQPNRVWYNYPGQPNTINSGSLDKVSAKGRVLDDGTSQVGDKATYNAFGNLLTKTDVLGRASKFTYATNNIDLSTAQQLTTLPSTYTTIATFSNYNTQHEPQTYVGADGKTWTYTYNAAGQLATVTDPNSGVTTYNYDASSRLMNIQDANLVTAVAYTYDTADRVLTRTDSTGYVLTYAYDAIDRVTKITYPDGTTDLYDYTFQSGPLVGTPSLELRKHTDRLGRITTYGYDADRRLTSVTEPLTSTTTRTTNYDYYENGTLKDIIDANSNDTHWDIDIQSRPIDKIYGFGGATPQTETYAYEATTSRLHSVTDALGQVKTYTYALDDRITGITYTATVNPTPNVTFTWDPRFPRLASMTDGLGTTNYSYTAIGTLGGLRLSSINGPFTSNDTLGLTYDALGRLAGRTISGGNETFGYDPISRINSHVTPLGSFTYAYQNETDLTTSRSVTNGTTTVSTNWVYDMVTGHDRHLININNSGVTRSYALSYLSGTSQNPYDILKATDTAATGHPWATRAHTYTYDLSDRLLTGTNGLSPYVYDKLDNATTFATNAATYNGFNQIGTWNALTYAYDANGNLTSGDGVKTYKWDAENRLIEIDYVGSAVKKSVFSYDGLGHRTVDAETTTGGVTTTTRYLWCGSSICQTRSSADVVQRRDLDEGEFNATTSQKLIYMPDQLGSVRDVLDGTTGALVQSYDFNPYGSQNRASGSVPTDYRFARLLLHTVSGLNLARFRAQDGVTGRFVNRDPLGSSAGVNLYAYTGADPITYSDSIGLCKVEVRYKVVFTITDSDGNTITTTNHAYIVTTDPTGMKKYFRGGPSGIGLFGWGHINAQYGDYTPNTKDWDPGSPPSDTVLDDGKPCTCENAALQKAANDINNSTIPYSPFSPNSNSAAHYALQQMGLSLSNPSVWVPAWNTPLLITPPPLN